MLENNLTKETKMLNKVMMIGKLVKEPELKFIPSGQSVCNFSIAMNEKFTDKQGNKQERTEYASMVVWGKQGELCNTYLSKGSLAYFEGKFCTRSWENKEGKKQYTTEVLVQNVRFLGGKKTTQPKKEVVDYKKTKDMNFAADDIPF